MKKYHDQTVIDNTVQRIKSKNEEEIKELKEFFIKELKHAKIMVKKISKYTEPMDVKNRHEILHYYQDIIAEMDWGNDIKLVI